MMNIDVPIRILLGALLVHPNFEVTDVLLVSRSSNQQVRFPVLNLVFGVRLVVLVQVRIVGRIGVVRHAGVAPAEYPIHFLIAVIFIVICVHIELC